MSCTGGTVMSKSCQAPRPRQWPLWLQDLSRSLAVRSQFILFGNISDFYLIDIEGTPTLAPMVSCLWEALRVEGYEFLLVYDRVDGIRVHPSSCQEAAASFLDEDFADDSGVSVLRVSSKRKLTECLASVVHGNDRKRIAFVIDYASRLTTRPQDLSGDEHEFFVSCEKLANTAFPKAVKGAAGPAAYNPVIWLINRENDLPDWFHVGNESIRSLLVPVPDFEARRATAEIIGSRFPDIGDYDAAAQKDLLERFAATTQGLTLKSMDDIRQLASGTPPVPLNRIDDAVRCYKVGTLDDPWKKDYVRSRIRSGLEAIRKDVKGQDEAVQRTLDILTRSVMGMSGAHSSRTSGRPRGVLFFAGPTGVGKTELARAVTRLIFDDERAYIRFDMSEFSAEHSDQRLIGAPPGYVGYDVGGELTNALRQRPFSVVLFDEIEKAHPRILDKFLQILEDGRLTDGHGETVYFSEAVIIFTSNLGVYVPVRDERGRIVDRKENVNPKMSYEEVKQNICDHITEHFRYELNRPELLNRLGDNIVVFDFIRPAIAQEIFEKMLNAVLARVQDEHKIAIEVPLPERTRLMEWCTQDLHNGGRGIGNCLETHFVNPLARALFDLPELKTGSRLTVRSITCHQGQYRVKLG